MEGDQSVFDVIHYLPMMVDNHHPLTSLVHPTALHKVGGMSVHNEQ